MSVSHLQFPPAARQIAVDLRASPFNSIVSVLLSSIGLPEQRPLWVMDHNTVFTEVGLLVTLSLLRSWGTNMLRSILAIWRLCISHLALYGLPFEIKEKSDGGSNKLLRKYI